MAIIKIDDVDYDTEDMSTNAKAQLASLQFNEAHIQQLKNETYENLHIVWGMVKDKKTSKILNLLPKNAKYYWCSPKIERALTTKELETNAFDLKLKGKTYDSVLEAKENAIKSGGKNDLVFIGGSTFVVAEAL